MVSKSFGLCSWNVIVCKSSVPFWQFRIYGSLSNSDMQMVCTLAASFRIVSRMRRYCHLFANDRMLSSSERIAYSINSHPNSLQSSMTFPLSASQILSNLNHLPRSGTNRRTSLKQSANKYPAPSSVSAYRLLSSSYRGLERQYRIPCSNVVKSISPFGVWTILLSAFISGILQNQRRRVDFKCL